MPTLATALSRPTKSLASMAQVRSETLSLYRRCLRGVCYLYLMKA